MVSANIGTIRRNPCPIPAISSGGESPLSRVPMDFDDLLIRYFGTTDLAEASPAVRAAGVDRLRVEFGLETDRGRRFALWSLLYMLGEAPDLDVAFTDPADRDAARDLMDLLG